MQQVQREPQQQPTEAMIAALHSGYAAGYNNGRNAGYSDGRQVSVKEYHERPELERARREQQAWVQLSPQEQHAQQERLQLCAGTKISKGVRGHERQGCTTESIPNNYGEVS